MSLLTNGYLQDGIKAFIYLIPFVYLILKKDKLNLRYFWLFFVGFGLLFFGHLVDFIDECEFLKNWIPVEKCYLWADFCEDVIGFTLGFAVLITAAYLELKKRRNTE